MNTTACHPSGVPRCLSLALVLTVALACAQGTRHGPHPRRR